MTLRVVPPSVSVSIRLTPDDECVLRALADAHGVSAAEVMRWALRWYALDGPYGLNGHPKNDNLRDYCEGAGVGPATYELADPAEAQAREGDSVGMEWSGGARVK